MPTTKQWWITGFNPEYVGEVDVHDLTMVGCIDMSGNEELFNYFVKQYQNINIDNHSDWENVCIDETSHCFWICWGDQS
ncbi:MAG: hypothetical protein LUI06_08795 [Ruminococcus sp.]|nr:hypothetical protein [Ruminococcus sp.]